ncbi:Early nodulin 93 ENOD93 protein [Arabidopsis thaliana x Arabidopsis arenosa]|uniref:Early nodulin 93 ENOD93 protein n=1 Tax=Arabidopsis thaliana x Arabidopsis arenosa TaxID=1240361 RepID=A0A8T1Z215_9BRAS|nr:Early nodulin 93 ENOD93 protein [Arabidopsis thaliana x Arabidopsis arenosa]
MENRSEMGNRRQQNLFVIASPDEIDKIRRAETSSQAGAIAGAKAAAVAAVASAIPTVAAVRVFPWAKANLNYTAQALIISAASIAAFFITADKTILQGARRNTEAQLKKAQQDSK